MATLLEAGLKIFSLFLPFVLGKNLFGILVALQLCIGVRDLNVDNAVGATCPHATDKNVATVVVNEQIDAFNGLFLGWSRNSWATGMDSGFVTNS